METFSLAKLLDGSKNMHDVYNTLNTILEIIENEENPVEAKLNLIKDTKDVLAAGFIQNSYPKFREEYNVYCVGKGYSITGAIYGSVSGMCSIEAFSENLRARMRDVKDYCVENRGSKLKYKDVDIVLKQLKRMGLIDMLNEYGAEVHIVMSDAGHLLRDSESEIRKLPDGGFVHTIVIYNNKRGQMSKINTAYLVAHEIGHLVHTLLADSGEVPESFISMLEEFKVDVNRLDLDNVIDLYADILAMSCLYGTKEYIDQAQTENERIINDSLLKSFKNYFINEFEEGAKHASTKQE